MDNNRKRIYLCLAKMSDSGLEKKYVNEAFDTNWVVPLGPNVTRFEELLSDYVGEEKHVVALSSGTAAIHLALTALGVGAGDEVCVQSFTFCASAHPVTYLGAMPVFIDSESDTWNMDPELLEKAILDRKAKTGSYPKAIIPVSLYGMPYRIDRIMEIADCYGIPVIEDSAEGLGSRLNGRCLGTFGKYGVLSFNGNKMITTSGGGALICQDDVDKANITYYATQARVAYPYYHHEQIGFNYRLSNVSAGIGIGQMSVLQEHIYHHKHIQQMYEQLLKDIPGIHIHRQPDDKAFDSNFWLCTLTLDPDLRIKGQDNAYKNEITTAVGGAANLLKMPKSTTTDCQPNNNVEALRVYLSEQCNIEARPLWKPMHCQPVYNVDADYVYDDELGCTVANGSQMTAYINGVSENLFKVGLCLPSGPCVTDDDIHYIINSIRSAIE